MKALGTCTGRGRVGRLINLADQPGASLSRHLITSALPYIDGVKHLGNLVGSMLPADVYARYLRSGGEEVLFVSATDEHGTPAELAAYAAGQDVAEFCAEQHEVQRELCEQFGLSWDWFGRTSLPQNHSLTNHFARRLRDEGFCEIRSTAQVFSKSDDRFLPDRYVIGTCRTAVMTVPAAISARTVESSWSRPT